MTGTQNSCEGTQVYLASGASDDRLYDKGPDGTRVYLAGNHITKNGKDARHPGIYILESYYYIRDMPWFADVLKTTNQDFFMLDSGAFTFMQDKKQVVNWDKYLEDYAAFINQHNIVRFFEFDIDSVVGLKRVELFRTRLEDLTGKPCIPVWHKSRGKNAFVQMCKDYEYVAIGGIVAGEIKKKEFRHFPWFIKTAHDHGAKIHGLGLTSPDNILKHHFDSVDTTAWLYGSICGYLYHFDGKEMLKKEVPPDMRLRSREATYHNFKEWVRFQRYVLHRRRTI